MKQIVVTTAMGKRLIGKGMVAHPSIKRVLAKGTLVIIAGTTNGYVAEELLKSLGQAEGFSRVGFRRGLTVAPGAKTMDAELAGDVVIVDGKWLPGKTIFDAVDGLKAGDVILKGANAFNPGGQAAVQIGHPQGGTVMAALTAVFGRRVELIVPVGLEKRVYYDVNDMAGMVNSPGGTGARFLVMPGEVVTEIEALALLCGVDATLLAAGGVYGAEGASWLVLEGPDDAEMDAVQLVRSISKEPACEV